MIKKIIILVLSLLVALVLMEIILRIFWKPFFLNPLFKRDDLRWLQQGVKLNRFNYRDREFDLRKQQDIYRVYVLGDSYTFGWYINDPSLAYPKVLEKELRIKTNNQGIEIINAGRHGYDLNQYVGRFKDEGFLFNPDLVVVGINIWDSVNAKLPKPFTANKFIRDLRIYQLSFGTVERIRLNRYSFKALNESYSESSSDFLALDATFRNFKKQVESTGSDLLVVVFPEYNPSRPNDKYLFDFYHQQIAKIGQKYDIRIVDLKEAYEKYPDKTELVLNPTDPHPSIVANQIAGEYIAENILSNGLLNKRAVPYESKQYTLLQGDEILDLNGILDIKPSDWVFINESDTRIQRQFLPLSLDRRIFYLEDSLLTAKSQIQDGWPGAKIEYYYPKSLENILVIPKTLYGFPVLGISKINAFWRIDGALSNEEIDLRDLDIIQDKEGIKVKVKKNQQYDMYKLAVDIGSKQVDVINNKIKNFSRTIVLSKTMESNDKDLIFELENEVYSLPYFFGPTEKSGYVWVGDRQLKATFKIDEKRIYVDLDTPINPDTTITLPVRVNFDISNDLLPVVTYF